MNAARLSSTASTSTSARALLGRRGPAPVRTCGTRRQQVITAFLAGAITKLQRVVAEPAVSHSVADTPSVECRPASAQVPKKLTFSWAGSGLYFFWQLGASQYLAEHFDLARLHMSGASGGSIAATLAACKVPADVALSTAYELSHKYELWDRPTAIVGVLADLVEEWLDALLPDNAHDLCRGRITVVVTTLPDMKQVGISDFKDKRDLINTIMASSHVPFVLDLKGTRNCRGLECVDGSLPDFFYGNCDLLTKNGDAIVFDYFDDANLNRQGRMDMLQLTSYDDLRERMQIGYRYAENLHKSGEFDSFVIDDELLVAGKATAAAAAAAREHSTQPCTAWPKTAVELASA